MFHAILSDFLMLCRPSFVKIWARLAGEKFDYTQNPIDFNGDDHLLGFRFKTLWNKPTLNQFAALSLILIGKYLWHLKSEL